MSVVFETLELSLSLSVDPYRVPVFYPFGVIHVECSFFVFGFLNSPFLLVWARIGLQCTTRLGSYTWNVRFSSILELSLSLSAGPYRVPVFYPLGVIHMEC